MGKDVNIDLLLPWIGKSETAHDYVSASLIDRFRATLGQHLWPSRDTAPLGMHWCLSLPTTPTGDLAVDGHAQKGGFLPPVPLPSRMWAGGEIIHHHDLPQDTAVTRRSDIADIVAKKGRSGDLVFVTIRSRFYASDTLCITEHQSIVFRSASKLAHRPATNPDAPATNGTRYGSLTPDPVLLFRYSALTFNAHRIHYDQAYARDCEGYRGLVVHGPLQATLLLNLAAKIAGSPPRRFSYRGLAPVTDGNAISLYHSGLKSEGTVWCQTDDGTKTFVADYGDPRAD